jgi:hypothetical protein
MFDTLTFPQEIDDRIKEFAFEKGTTMAIMRRVGGIYFRDVCLDEFKMNPDEIDILDPENTPK